MFHLNSIQADQIEIQLKLIQRKTKRSTKCLSLSPSVSPVGSPLPPGAPAEVESPAQMTSHQRSHIAPSHVDTANSTSALTRHQTPDTTQPASLVVRLSQHLTVSLDTSQHFSLSIRLFFFSSCSCCCRPNLFL